MEYNSSWDALLKPGQAEDYFQNGFSGNRTKPAFVPETHEYNHVTAWWLSEMSRLIYKRDRGEKRCCDERRSRHDYLKKAQFYEYRFISSDSVQCAVFLSNAASAERFGVLAFRGTNNFENWLSNLNTLQVGWPRGGSVHGGFKKEFFKVLPELNEVLNTISFPMFYTGHSLGGALATLAASMRPPRALYTFGSPRVGDSVFAKILEKSTIYRIVNDRDIVPTLPPSRIPFDYRHVGVLKRFSNELGKAGNVSSMIVENGGVSDEKPEEPAAGEFPEKRFTDPPKFLSDHSPANYSAYLSWEASKTGT